jgi:hypothetical protein
MYAERYFEEVKRRRTDYFFRRMRSEKIKKMLISIFVLMLIHKSPFFIVPSQYSKGTIRIDVTTEKGKRVILYEKSYALLIGIWDYKNGWPRLQPGNIEKDIKTVDGALKKHSFITRKVLNPTYQELIKEINQFKNKYGLEPNNRLVFYFSGHGMSRHKNEIGYIVPKDTPFPDTPENEKEFLKRSVSMEQFKTLAKEIESKHVLFLFDSCFAGAIFQSFRGDTPGTIKEDMSLPVRLCITAGRANQKVPEKSVFTPAFVRGINGDADKGDGDGYITGNELFLYIKSEVESKKKSSPQNPQRGWIKVPGKQNKGDIVFILEKRIDSREIFKKRREGKKNEFKALVHEAERQEKKVGVYLKNREIAEIYREILKKYDKYLDDFKQDKELSLIIKEVEKKVGYYDNQPDFVNILIRVHPYGHVYINDDDLGEVPPQAVKEKIQEDKKYLIRLVKDKETYVGEFVVEKGQIKWIKKTHGPTVTIMVKE